MRAVRRPRRHGLQGGDREVPTVEHEAGCNFTCIHSVGALEGVCNKLQARPLAEPWASCAFQVRPFTITSTKTPEAYSAARLSALDVNESECRRTR
jgi:hypothetical protein